VARYPAGRIRGRSAVTALKRSASRASRGPIRVQFQRDTEAAARAFPLVGYAISRRNGNAVARNRLRRRLRAIIQDAAGSLEPGTYLVSTSPGAGALPRAELAQRLIEALQAAAADLSTAGAW
jgi:ribonuclease P protein component